MNIYRTSEDIPAYPPTQFLPTLDLIGLGKVHYKNIYYDYDNTRKNGLFQFWHTVKTIEVEDFKTTFFDFGGFVVLDVRFCPFLMYVEAVAYRKPSSLYALDEWTGFSFSRGHHEIA